MKGQFCFSVAFQRCVCDAAPQESRALLRAVCGHGARQGLQGVGQGLHEGHEGLTGTGRDGEKT